jgi:hypothetical protein
MSKKNANAKLINRDKRMKHDNDDEDLDALIQEISDMTEPKGNSTEKKSKKNSKKAKDSDEEEEDDRDNHDHQCHDPTHNHGRSSGKKSTQPQGYNWAAIGIMAMFALPLLIGGVLQVNLSIY